MAYERNSFIGNINTVEPRVSQNKSHYIKISVAVNQKEGKTRWYTVLMFGEEEQLAPYLKRYCRGQKVLCEGRPVHSVGKDKDGNLQVDHTIVAHCPPEIL